MKSLTTQFDRLIEKYRKQGKVTEIKGKEYDDLMDAITEGREEFRIKEQERRVRSAEAIATVVLTA